MYRGRFAPSPTGPLHFGSLVAAVASYLDARSVGGEWLVRMEDVDTPRTVPGASAHILHTLRRFGFKFAEPVMYQSARTAAYESALSRLAACGMAYPCSCSRREAGLGAYSGACRAGVREPGRPIAWRVRTEAEYGDFVIKRSDGIFAYQLAVVVDDAEQGITDVVRGADLLDSTPRQIWLQQLLGYPHPRYLHVSVVVNETGEKLSKQTLAPALSEGDPLPELRAALSFLGQPEAHGATPAELLAAAAMQWKVSGPRE